MCICSYSCTTQGRSQNPHSSALLGFYGHLTCPVPETLSKSQKEKSCTRQLDVVTLCPADLFDFSGTSVPGRVGAVGCPQVTVTPWGGIFLWKRSDANKLTPLHNSCVVVSFWHQAQLEQPWAAEAGTLETQVSCSSRVHKCSVFAREEYILEEFFNRSAVLWDSNLILNYDLIKTFERV